MPQCIQLAQNTSWYVHHCAGIPPIFAEVTSEEPTEP